jgi:hypothetical protein
LGRLDPPRRGGLKRVVIAALLGTVLVAAGSAAALLATPWLVERSLARFGRTGPDRTASAAAVRFDPLSLTLELEAFELRDDAAGIAVTAQSVSLDFDWRGFIGFGPRSFERVTIERPRLECRSLAQLRRLGDELSSGSLAGLRIDRLTLGAGELALAVNDSSRRPAKSFRNDISPAGTGGRIPRCRNDGVRGTLVLEEIHAPPHAYRRREPRRAGLRRLRRYDERRSRDNDDSRCNDHRSSS